MAPHRDLNNEVILFLLPKDVPQAYQTRLQQKYPGMTIRWRDTLTNDGILKPEDFPGRIIQRRNNPLRPIPPRSVPGPEMPLRTTHSRRTRQTHQQLSLQEPQRRRLLIQRRPPTSDSGMGHWNMDRASTSFLPIHGPATELLLV